MSARGEDISIVDRRAGAAGHDGRLDRPRGRLHQHPVPRADLARPVRGVLERLAGDRRRSRSRSARTRRTCSAASCGARPGSRCSSRRPTPAARSSRRRACGRGSGSASAGSPRSSTCSRRTCATSRRCCRSSRTRTRSRSSRRAARRSCTSCGCTTARSTAGTGRSTTSSTGSRTCGSRTACLGAGPTVVDLVANAAFYFGLVRAPGRERAAAVVPDVVLARPRRTSTPPPSTASTPRSTGRASARCGPPSSSCAGCCRWPTQGLAAWGVPAEESTGCSASSSSAACSGTNGAEWFAGRMRDRSDLDRYDALRATLQEYREQHAHQRAGPHLGVTPQRADPLPRRRRSPLRGSHQPCRVTTTHARSRPASA